MVYANQKFFLNLVSFSMTAYYTSSIAMLCRDDMPLGILMECKRQNSDVPFFVSEEAIHFDFRIISTALLHWAIISQLFYTNKQSIELDKSIPSNLVKS